MLFATTDLVERALQACREYHLPLVSTFVDYEKAFDSVETNAILSALVGQGVDLSYAGRLLPPLLYDSYSTVFPTPINIPIEESRDTISPKLFTAALQWVIELLDWEEKGIRVDGKFLSNLRFADDIVIFAKSTTEAETMLRQLDEAERLDCTRIGRRHNL